MLTPASLGSSFCRCGSFVCQINTFKLPPAGRSGGKRGSSFPGTNLHAVLHGPPLVTRHGYESLHVFRSRGLRDLTLLATPSPWCDDRESTSSLCFSLGAFRDVAMAQRAL